MLPLPEYVQEAMAGKLLIQTGTATPAHRSTSETNASMKTPARLVRARRKLSQTSFISTAMNQHRAPSPARDGHQSLADEDTLIRLRRIQGQQLPTLSESKRFRLYGLAGSAR